MNHGMSPLGSHKKVALLQLFIKRSGVETSRHFVRIAPMTKARIFFFLLLAFVAGVGVRSFFIVPYEILFAFFLLAGTMIAFGAIRGRPRAVVFGVLLVSSIFGVVRYDWHENARPDLSNLYGKSFQMEGAVAREPSRGEKSQLFVF